MPELPEVETTLRGLTPHLAGRRVKQVVIRHPQLRWPVPEQLPALLEQQPILGLRRRAKYLIVDFPGGALILHLGMSGSLRILPAGTLPGKHDHFDLVLDDGQLMRLRDPRRFGAVLWQEGEAGQHQLFSGLGPEPLDAAFDAAYLHAVTRKRKAAIKLVLMDNHVVVGVGNIYANEALFRAGIRPQQAAGRLTRPRAEKLVQAIRETLQEAIIQGGSTLRDFTNSAGEPGYFQQHYFVYGRTGEPCHVCGTAIRQLRQGQRSSFYCAHCQR